MGWVPAKALVLQPMLAPIPGASNDLLRATPPTSDVPEVPALPPALPAVP